MNIHALEATGGYVHSEMGQYQAKPDAPKSQLAPGGGTSNTAYAVTDPKTGQPVPNGARLILAGIGFGVLALGATAPQPKREQTRE